MSLSLVMKEERPRCHPRQTACPFPKVFSKPRAKVYDDSLLAEKATKPQNLS